MMAERLYAIRGATGAENTAESIQKNVCEMCLRLFSENRLAQGNFVSIQFTITDDLDAMNRDVVLANVARSVLVMAGLIVWICMGGDVNALY